VLDLLGCELHLSAKLNASALRGLHSGAGAFRDERPFELSIMRCTALCRLCGAGDYAKPQP
jgi:hypothetical protein